MRMSAGNKVDLTAVYTGVTWWWAGFDCAELLHVPAARLVFWITNCALWFFGLFRTMPSLRHSLVQRHWIISKLVKDSGLTRVIDAPAGFSPRGCSFTRNPAIDYTEVDLPGVVETKLQLLARTPAGREVVGRPNWAMLPADLLKADLSDIYNGPDPLFFVSEGWLMYLDRGEQHLFWKQIASYLCSRPGSIFVFDLVPGPEKNDHGFPDRLLGAAFRLLTGGDEIVRDPRTRSEFLEELRECGFSSVELIEPGDATSWTVPFLDRHTQMLLFVCRCE